MLCMLTCELLNAFIQISLFRHTVYEGGLANTGRTHKIADLESRAPSLHNSQWQQFGKGPLKNSI